MLPGAEPSQGDALLVQLRVHGCIDPARSSVYEKDRVRTAQLAFARTGWILCDEGLLDAAGAIDLSTGGREALDEQVARLRRAAEEPGKLLGSAKDLLEAVAKFVLAEFGLCPTQNDSFDHLWYLARDRLQLLPEQVNPALSGTNNIKAILQSSRKITEQVNKLRGFQGGDSEPGSPDTAAASLISSGARLACDTGWPFRVR
jgi:hypothetical protein